jgi:UPF0176 protein
MMATTAPYRVLLYYKFVSIEEPEAFTKAHLHYCTELGILGRILIAAEGINGTLSGTVEQTEAYMAHIHSDPRFADMVFKIDEAHGHVFRKLFVRHRQELVTFRVPYDLDPNKTVGKYLKPAEWRQMLDRKDVIIVDARTDYEYDLGHFRGAIRPDGVKSFREFPDWVKANLSQYKDRPVLTYCTGGIRCEKFTGFLLHEGFKDVYHLEGGIVSYGKDPETQGEAWEGKCYVFDERIAVPVGDRAEVVSTCLGCDISWDHYQNCANLDCRTQVFLCPACEQDRHRSCSEACYHSERNIYPFTDKKSWLQHARQTVNHGT